MLENPAQWAVLYLQLRAHVNQLVAENTRLYGVIAALKKSENERLN